MIQKEREIVEVSIVGKIQQTIEIVDMSYGDIEAVIDALNSGELHSTIEHYGASTVKGPAIVDENGLLVARVTHQTNLLEGGLYNKFTYIGTQEPDE